jgi:hypothetical protein
MFLVAPFAQRLKIINLIVQPVVILVMDQGSCSSAPVANLTVRSESQLSVHAYTSLVLMIGLSLLGSSRTYIRILDAAGTMCMSE